MNTAGFPDYALTGNGKTITFNSGTPDAFGSYWYMDQEMQGWDSPDGRVTMLTKIGTGPNADGEYPADNHYRGRTLLFTLYASCTSETNRENSRLLLAQVLDLVGTTGTLEVNEAVPKQVAISRAGNNNQGKLVMADMGFSTKPPSTPDFPTADPDPSTGLIMVLKADVEVYAADPRKYSNPDNGPIPIEANSFTITNAGNTHSTDFFVDIIGGVAGSLGPLHLTVVNADGTTVMTLAVPVLPATAPALSPFPTEIGINFYLNTIRDGSGNVIYYLRDLRTPWLVLAPGDNVFTFTGPDVTMIDGSATWNDAWI